MIVRSLLQLRLTDVENRIYRWKHGTDDDRLPFWASMGYQAFGSMVLCLLGSACATWLQFGEAELEARVRTAFLDLDPDLVIALAGVNCALRPLKLRHLEDVGHAMADLFGVDYRHPDAVLREQSSTFKDLQRVLRGPLIPCRETLSEDLMRALVITLLIA